jgi:streptogramin lyase
LSLADVAIEGRVDRDDAEPTATDAGADVAAADQASDRGAVADADSIDASADGDGAATDVTLPPAHPTREFFLAEPSGRPLWIAVGPDGNMWFTDNGPFIWRITLAGQISKFGPFGTDDDPISFGDLTTGPDGNLWLVDPSRQKIARFTTAGALTVLPLPINAAWTESIASGPDGNLWFAGRNGSAISRITPAGLVITFQLPSGNTAYDVTGGPDGNIWFTETGHGVAHITPNGDGLVEIAFPIGDSNQIAAGPDGNIWVTEIVLARIARITPAGELTEFTIPTSGSRPIGIAAGPDGNVWFGEGRAANIGRITPLGDITEFPVPQIGVRGVSAGPDGNVWFTLGDGASVGYITP